jgi:hypothetical protein
MTMSMWALTFTEVVHGPRRGQLPRIRNPDDLKRSSGSWLFPVVIAPVLSLLAPALSMGCDTQGGTRAEARELMTSLNAVSDQGSMSDRSAAIERLDRLPLHVPAHLETRKVCRAAHLGLLEAESAQAEARRALATGSALERAQAAVIAEDIARSNRALAIAKQRFPECENAMRQLLRTAH